MSSAAEIVVVLTTVPSDEVGEAIARALVGERLAACVNVLPPMVSFYRWEGAVNRDVERQLIVKTTRERLPAIERRLAELHPYELPELLVLPAAGGSDAYLEWVRTSAAPHG
jgi:periplasmic divalent cation tolerance protein